MAYYNRRTISEKAVKKDKPYNDNGRLNKGFYFAGNGVIKDTQGNKFLISDYK